MTRANLNKSKFFFTSTTTASNYIPRGLESASIEMPPFRSHFIKISKTVFYEVYLVSQCSHLEVVLLNIIIDVDSGPLRCALWCYGSYSNWLWPYSVSFRHFLVQ